MVWKPDYATAAELKKYLRITDAIDDVEIGFAVTAASRAVDNYTHRQFGKTDSVEDRFYTAQWDRNLCRWVIVIDDVMTTVGFVVSADLDANGSYSHVITEYDLEPINNVKKGKPFEALVVKLDAAIKPNSRRHGVKISATWGWSAVPTSVKQATLLQGSRFMARRQAPFGVAGSPETGSEVRLLAKLDPDVAVSLRDYVRWWAAA